MVAAAKSPDWSSSTPILIGSAASAGAATQASATDASAVPIFRNSFMIHPSTITGVSSTALAPAPSEIAVSVTALEPADEASL